MKSTNIAFPSRFGVFFLLALCFRVLYAFSAQDPPPVPMKVLVTGAAGKTGRLVLKKLEADPRYEPKGLVRTERSAIQLIKGDMHTPLEHIVVSDITSSTFEEDLPSGLEGMDAMIICTSAVPRISRLSLTMNLLLIPWNLIRQKKVMDFRKLQFRWKYGGTPEKVDYHGQVAQIELAKKLGMKQVVIVSSMGGTNPNNFLNTVGKSKDGSGDGDILLWKRKAEMHLIESGLNYKIIHPGGLVDTPGGMEEFVLDVDDRLGKLFSRTRICREDLADLCVAALSVNKDISFDCITQPVKEDGIKPKSAGEALQAFLEHSKTANYAL